MELCARAPKPSAGGIQPGVSGVTRNQGSMSGMVVMISPWLMHRHKKLWERPEAFIPDRFEGKPQDYLTNGAYIPFGCGPRICIGATFSLAEASVVLAMLLQRFDVDLDDDRPVTPVSIITTMPDIEPWFRVTPLAPG